MHHTDSRIGGQDELFTIMWQLLQVRISIAQLQKHRTIIEQNAVILSTTNRCYPNVGVQYHSQLLTECVVVAPLDQGHLCSPAVAVVPRLELFEPISCKLKETTKALIVRNVCLQRSHWVSSLVGGCTSRRGETKGHHETLAENGQKALPLVEIFHGEALRQLDCCLALTMRTCAQDHLLESEQTPSAPSGDLPSEVLTLRIA
mmetsp:Transcript_29827/g.69366  ORF Transcript_29827/g.69366 Transcript_29827/m.69366 type:complete len:203 (+) Transcript_29827:197-805(+)